MRKVRFKTWIKAEFKEFQTGGGKDQISGTGCWSPDYDAEGYFHQWGAAYEEFQEGPGNYTVALVEIKDGTIVEVLPSNLKFIY